MSTNREYWVFDGVRLSTEYSGVQYRAAGWGIPSRSGSNLANTNKDGSTWQPHKPFEEKIIPLALWVTGGTTDPLAQPATILKERIDALTYLFGRSGSLFRLERKNYMDGAVNRLTNPRLSATTTRSTGVSKLSSPNHTAAVDGYIGFELNPGAVDITVAGQRYTYNASHPIAGWVPMIAGQVSSGLVPEGSNIFFYNPVATNHVPVAHVFPLPRAVEQWQPFTWNGGNLLAIGDAHAQLNLRTPAGGVYSYGADGYAVAPLEDIESVYGSSSMAPIYVAELSDKFAPDLRLTEFPTKLFPGIKFADASFTSIISTAGNFALVPTISGEWILPAGGAVSTYDTYGVRFPGSTSWGNFYGSGMVEYRGAPPITEIDPLGTGTTLVRGAHWWDAWFGTAGQTVRVTVKNAESFIVSPTKIVRAGLYTHTEKIAMPPEFFDGFTFNATWTGAENNSPTLIHTGRWIDVECPTSGVEFSSMAGGTRADMSLELIAPEVYWRDNEELSQTFTFTEALGANSPSVGRTLEMGLFAGGTGPLGNLEVDLKATSVQTGYDLTLVLEDVATMRQVRVTFPVNSTWRLDSNKFLFYQALPVTVYDRYASVQRVTRNYGGDLMNIFPMQDRLPRLRISAEFPIPTTVDFTVTVRGVRRYLSA